MRKSNQLTNTAQPQYLWKSQENKNIQCNIILFIPRTIVFESNENYRSLLILSVHWNMSFIIFQISTEMISHSMGYKCIVNTKYIAFSLVENKNRTTENWHTTASTLRSHFFFYRHLIICSLQLKTSSNENVIFSYRIPKSEKLIWFLVTSGIGLLTSFVLLLDMILRLLARTLFQILIYAVS